MHRNTKFNFAALASIFLASQSYSALTTSGLNNNFDASVGSNTTSIWKDQKEARDLSANPESVTQTLGPVSSTLTTIDTAYGLDGTSNSGFTQGVVNTFSLDNSNSFELWFRPNAASLDGALLWETGGSTGLYVGIDSLGNLNAFAEGDTLTWAFNSENLGYNPTSDFTQIVLTADQDNTGDGKGLKLYVNGSLAAEGTAATWNGTGNHDGLGQVGGSQLGGYGGSGGPAGVRDTLDGDLAIFRVYGGILTSGEVSDNYNAVAVPEPATLSLFLMSFLSLVLRRRR